MSETNSSSTSPKTPKTPKDNENESLHSSQEFDESNTNNNIKYKCIFCSEDYNNIENHIKKCELFNKHCIKDRKYFFTNHCITSFEDYKNFIYIPSEPIDIPRQRRKSNQ